jgi:hypothetical protein
MQMKWMQYLTATPSEWVELGKAKVKTTFSEKAHSFNPLE